MLRLWWDINNKVSFVLDKVMSHYNIVCHILTINTCTVHVSSSNKHFSTLRKESDE